MYLGTKSEKARNFLFLIYFWILVSISRILSWFLERHQFSMILKYVLIELSTCEKYFLRLEL